MREIITHFIEKKERKSIPLQIQALSIYMNMLKDLGYTLEDNGDCLNGFSVDFAYPFKKEGEKTLYLTGSLWYGNYSLNVEEK